MTTRSGIPIDTLPTAPTLREAAQRVIDETTVQDSVHGGSVGIVPYGAIEDLENILAATPEPALSDEDAIDALARTGFDATYYNLEWDEDINRETWTITGTRQLNFLRERGYLITRIGGAS